MKVPKLLVFRDKTELHFVPSLHLPLPLFSSRSFISSSPKSFPETPVFHSFFPRNITPFRYRTGTPPLHLSPKSLTFPLFSQPPHLPFLLPSFLLSYYSSSHPSIRPYPPGPRSPFVCPVLILCVAQWDGWACRLDELWTPRYKLLLERTEEIRIIQILGGTM